MIRSIQFEVGGVARDERGILEQSSFPEGGVVLAPADDFCSRSLVAGETHFRIRTSVMLLEAMPVGSNASLGARGNTVTR
jgi:hypothetical protein